MLVLNLFIDNFLNNTGVDAFNRNACMSHIVYRP